LLKLQLPDTAVVEYGGPAGVFLAVEFPEQEPSIRWTLEWFDKRATRLPEANEIMSVITPLVPRSSFQLVFRGFPLEGKR
jgi:hypothetical protein